MSAFFNLITLFFISFFISFYSVSQTNASDYLNLELARQMTIEWDTSGNGNYIELHLEYVFNHKKRSDGIIYFNDYNEFYSNYCSLDPKIVLVSDQLRDTLFLTDTCQYSLVFELLNVGDLDQDGKSEIAILIGKVEDEYAGFFQLYSRFGEKWVLFNEYPFYLRFESVKDSPISDLLEMDQDHNYKYYLDQSGIRVPLSKK